MSEMDKVAVTEKIRELIRTARKSDLSKGLRKAVWAPAAAMGSGAAKSGGSTIKNVLFGKPAMFGPMAGSRLRADKRGPGLGLKEITKKEYKDIMGKKVKGEAQVLTSPKGKKYYYKRMFRPGGLAGWARKNPLWAAGIAALGYMAGTSPEGRQAAGGMLPSAPRPQADPWLMNQLQRQPKSGNPFERQTWG